MFFPLWLLGLLMIGGAALLSVGGLAFVRRRVKPTTLREHHDVAGFILAIVGVIYAVVLAFVVLVVWERYGVAEVTAEREAIALVDIYRLAPRASPSSKEVIRADVRRYAQSVIEREWPVMERGESDDETSRALDALWSESTKIQTIRADEAVLLSQLLDRLTDVSDNRRLRLLSSRTGVPNPMWLVLILGGAATVGFTFYFGLERFKVQAGMTAILAGVIGLVLFLISALNYPFTGDLGVNPEAMQAALERCARVDAHEKG